jgi:4-hydroxy-tetrahydrodipicolinate synthase
VIAGTIPALLTPFTEAGEVDLELLDHHVAWLHERGIGCLSPMGTTGEGPSLSLGERKRLLERLVAHPAGVPILPGTGCTALPETIELSRFAVEQGAAGLLVAPPSYYDPFDVRGVNAYFVRLFDALPPSARVFLYHIPRQTGVPVTDETLHVLGSRYGPMLAGVKDSGGDFEHTRAWLREYPELTILNGSDATAAAAYEAGGRGTITMLANVFPEELERIRAGRSTAEPQRFLVAVRELVGEFPRHAALKHLLHLVSGLPRSSVRPPLQDLDGEQTAILQERFSELRSEAHV